MIKSIKINNFECFQDMSLSGFKHINIIVGANATGKTALLEAIYLGTRAIPHAALFINQSRGIQLPFISPEMFSFLFDHFFFKSNSKEDISIEIVDSSYGKHQLRIFYGEEQQIQMPIAAQPAESPLIAKPLLFERTDQKEPGKEIKTILKMQLNPTGLINYDRAVDFGPAATFLGSTIGYALPDTAAWWSDLSLRGEESKITKILCDEFPVIKEVKLLTPFGGLSAAFYAKTDFSNGSMLQLSLVSAGIYKLFTLLVSAMYYKSGIVLIDEIENGIYFKKYSNMWSLLYKFSQETACQFFVTTHSRECLEAAAETFKDNREQICLIRSEIFEGKTIIRQFTGDDALGAIEDNISVR